MVTICMALTIENRDRVDDHAHHLIKTRQSGCNCFADFACYDTLYYDNACGCITCGAPPTTTTRRTTTTISARCNAICVGRRRIPLANCPSCLQGAPHYGNGYYCCGGSMASSCAGRFTDAGDACACRGTSTTIKDDCIAYDGGCGYFGKVHFDSTCACFVCG